MGKIPLEKCSEIKANLDLGIPIIEIARRFGVHKTLVYRLKNKVSKTGSVKDQPRVGCPKKLDERDVRRMVNLSIKEPFLTAREVRNEANLEDTISLSHTRSILHKNNLKGRIAEKVPFLTEVQKANRLAFAKHHLKHDQLFWIKVDFSDECRFGLEEGGRIYVWRPTGARHDPRYQTKSFPNNRNNIMVWGVIKSDGTRKLVRITERLNSTAYCNLLEVYYREMNEGALLQQDGATCHTSKKTKEWAEANDIEFLANWPSSSPDLNPIENIWALIKQELKKKRVRSVDHLWELVEKEFYDIDVEFILKLYDSIPNRLNQVMLSNGGNTVY